MPEICACQRSVKFYRPKKDLRRDLF